MNKEFHQSVWNEELEQDWLRILDLAVREDLGIAGRLHDGGLGAGIGPGQGGDRRSPGRRIGGRGGNRRHLGKVQCPAW